MRKCLLRLFVFVACVGVASPLAYAQGASTTSSIQGVVVDKDGGAIPGATVVVKAAAVADYRVRRPAEAKIKGKRDLTLELTPNPDILAEVAATRTGAFVVGFAAETHDVAANARAKLEAKGIDLLVANDVSQAGIGFDAEDNEVLLIDRWGGTRALPRMSKSAVADEILSEIVRLRAAAHRAAGKAAR